MRSNSHPQLAYWISDLIRQQQVMLSELQYNLAYWISDLISQRQAVFSGSQYNQPTGLVIWLDNSKRCLVIQLVIYNTCMMWESSLSANLV